MKKLKQWTPIFFIMLFSAMIFTGCGTGKTANANNGSDWENGNAAQETEENRKDKANLYSPGQFGNTSSDNGMLNNTEENDNSMKEDAEGNTENRSGDNMENAADDVADDVGDAAMDVGDAAADAADDVADGIGDAIDNLGGGSFDKYEDARDYLLGKLKEDNAGAKYEIREETKDLTAYNHNDSGAEGYRFSVYETDGNEKIGIYYVDKDTGKIYRYMGKNSIEAY